MSFCSTELNQETRWIWRELQQTFRRLIDRVAHVVLVCALIGMSPVKTGGGGTIHGTCHGSRCPQTADDPDHIALHYPGDASLLLRWICTVRRRAAQPATNRRGQPGNAVENAHT